MFPKYPFHFIQQTPVNNNNITFADKIDKADGRKPDIIQSMRERSLTSEIYKLNYEWGNYLGKKKMELFQNSEENF